MKLPRLTLIAILIVLNARFYAVDKNNQPIPDLTRGEKLTRRNEGGIGPLGLEYDVWRPRQRTREYDRVRQLKVRSTAKGSPADGILLEGDVLLGAEGSGAGEVPLFERHPERDLADDIDIAEGRNPGTLKLLIWRPKDKAKPTEGGKNLTVSVTLKTLGAYSATAPYSCPKSSAIVEQGLEMLLKEKGPGAGGYNLLAIIAGEDPKNPAHEKYRAKAKEWAHTFKAATIEEVEGGAWQVGSVLISLAEYYGKTRDPEILKTLESYALRYARGQSWFGTTGHRWADPKPDGSPNGPMPGYGALNSSGLHGFLGMVLARRAGVKNGEVDAAIDRADAFFGCFAFRSGIGYGEHPWGIGGNPNSYDYNGHNGVAGLVFSMVEDRQKETRWFSMMSAATTSSDRSWAHAGPYFAQLYNPLGAAVGGIQGANHQFKEIRWHLNIHRNWDGTFQYRKGYGGWSRAATQILFYALPRRQIYLTGKGQPESLHFTAEELAALAGTKTFDAGGMNTEGLIKALASAFPADRTRAATELARRAAKPEAREDILTKLHAMASGKETSAMERAGACYALYMIKDKSSVKVLVSKLTDEDYYVRFVAAIGLMEFPADAVMPHLDTILKVAAETVQPTFPLVRDDPIQFGHGAVASLLFDGKKGLLRSSIKGVDRSKLWPAVRGIARTPAGRARSTLRNLYKQLSKEELLELGETIVESVRVRAPGDSMFCTGVQKAGLELLIKNSMALAPALVKNIRGAGNYYTRFDASILTPETTPELMGRLAEMQFLQGQDMSRALKALSASTAKEPAGKMKVIHAVTATPATIALPARNTRLRVKATNYARQDEKASTYAWRKVYGPGKVTFAPNANWQSKETTVTFSKAGKYRFEVRMSDTLGLSTVTETVDVTVNDKGGALPANRAPSAKRLTITTTPGRATEVILKGSDPDGDDLGFEVTRQPRHGKLTGTGANRTYTARFDFGGTDSFEFQVIDGQGVTARGTATITVDNQNTGVAVYEGFDYPEGPVNTCEGSFGFSAPWKVNKGEKDFYQIAVGSATPEGMPATGNKLRRGKHWWNCSRLLDPAVVARHKLLANGSEMWFSAIVLAPKAGSYNVRMGLRQDVDKCKIEFGFALSGGSLTPYSLGGGKAKSRFGWGNRRAEEKFPPNTPHMILARCLWGATDDASDTIEIYRVFHAPTMGPTVMKEPLSTMSAVIDQVKTDSLFVRGAEQGFIDELRVGTSLESVMLGTKPQE